MDRAIKRQLKDGITFPQPHPLEVEVAELLTEVIPSAEMVRFAKNGSDATSGAVRIARAFTGREIILQCGYHGAQDWFLITTARNAGVPRCLKEIIHSFNYNDLPSLEALFKRFKGKVAAVIMEPMYAKEPKDNFLQKAKDLAHKEGALLIFDEIITGFRWSIGGAQKYFGVTPDLSCFGKAMSNGMPLSAIVGRRDVMQGTEHIFLSMTYGGECLSLAAAKATITELRKPAVLAHIWKMGGLVKKGVQALINKHGLIDVVECIGVPPTPVMTFKNARGESESALKTLFQKYLFDQHIMYAGYFNMTYSHTRKDVETALTAVDRAFGSLSKDLEAKSVGKKMSHPPEPVFKHAN